MQSITNYILKQLQAFYPPEETSSFVRLILSAVCGLSYTQQICCKDKQISANEKKQIYTIVDRLSKMEPIQYILGETEFYSIPMKVNPSVMIPRPETEELVDLILATLNVPLGVASRYVAPPHIIDIGTGSGCIAIALAKHIPDAVVTAIDISEAALQTAKRNAQLCFVTQPEATSFTTLIRFIQADILDTEKTVSLFPEKFDLMVSNPPYIMAHEKASMSANVLDYEPHNALFVPADAPLLYYNAIADFAMLKLSSQGALFLEINPLCHTSIIELFQEKGFTQIEVIHDLSGKNRFITAINPL